LKVLHSTAEQTSQEDVRCCAADLLLVERASVNADREVQRRADPKVQRSGSG
jgi:hypothetical protein